MTKQQNLIIALVAMLLLGGLAYYVYEDFQSIAPEMDMEEESMGENMENDGTKEGNNVGSDSVENGGAQAGSGENTGSDQEEDQVADDPTAGWRSYTNNSLGLTFKFPSEWHMNEDSEAGEYTLQAYAGSANNKTTEFNVLFYEAELDRFKEGNFKSTVAGRSAYVAENTCPSATTCVAKKVIIPLEEGEIVGGTWSGSVVEMTALAHTIVTTQLKTTINNIISTIVIHR